MAKRTLRRTMKARRKTRKVRQQRRRQRGGSYNDPKDATVQTIGGVPITRDPTVVLGNRVLTLKEFKDYVERGETDQLGPDDI